MKDALNRVCNLFPCLAAACLVFACEESRLAGGSSTGVDNPAVTVAFVDDAGAPLAVEGDLDVFARDQSPALAPEPLWTLKIKGTSATLTAADIDRMPSAGKRAAGSGSAGEAGGGNLAFNLTFRGSNGTGAVRFGLAFDSAGRAFHAGGVSIAHLELRPQPAAEFMGEVQGGARPGEILRLYIPGTRFAATLVGTRFRFVAVPPGAYPLRLLDSAGRVFAAAESLDTRAPAPFAIDPEPLDTLAVPYGTGVRANAGSDRGGYEGSSLPLEGSASGVDSADKRLSFLWRALGTSSVAETIRIADATARRTEVTFDQEGAYRLELAVTLGLRTWRDTLIVAVRAALPIAEARLVQPRPNEILRAGEPYPIMWELPGEGPVTLLFSPDIGLTWSPIVSGYRNPSGISVYTWTPATELRCEPCFLRVLLDADTTVSAGPGDGFSVVGE